MSRIVEIYTNFFNSIPLNNNDEVDMTSLFEQCNVCTTPVQLKYNNRPESIANLSAVAIRNICRTYMNKNSFLKESVNDLSKILIGTENKHVIAQRILLIHYSKRMIDSGRLGFMLMHTCNMRVKDIVDPDETKWIELAYKVVSHIQINAIIDEAISKFGLPVCRVAEPYVEIRIVESSFPSLRGFVGLNQIFIHADNFASKIKAYKASPLLLQHIAKMDIIAVTTHELAHMKMRRITNDLNSHTPLMAALANVPPSPKGEIEFGVYVERNVFGKHVDWFASAHMLKRKGKAYVNQFIESVEEQTSLPEGHVTEELVERENSWITMSGLDIDVQSEFC